MDDRAERTIANDASSRRTGVMSYPDGESQQVLSLDTARLTIFYQTFR